MKISWYRVHQRPGCEPHEVSEVETVRVGLPEDGFVREYFERPDAPDKGALTLREFWIQAFSAEDALQRWKKAGE